MIRKWGMSACQRYIKDGDDAEFYHRKSYPPLKVNGKLVTWAPKDWNENRFVGDAVWADEWWKKKKDWNKDWDHDHKKLRARDVDVQPDQESEDEGRNRPPFFNQHYRSSSATESIDGEMDDDPRTISFRDGAFDAAAASFNHVFLVFTTWHIHNNENADSLDGHSDVLPDNSSPLFPHRAGDVDVLLSNSSTLVPRKDEYPNIPGRWDGKIVHVGPTRSPWDESGRYKIYLVCPDERRYHKYNLPVRAHKWLSYNSKDRLEILNTLRYALQFYELAVPFDVMRNVDLVNRLDPRQKKTIAKRTGRRLHQAIFADEVHGIDKYHHKATQREVERAVMLGAHTIAVVVQNHAGILGCYHLANLTMHNLNIAKGKERAGIGFMLPRRDIQPEAPRLNVTAELVHDFGEILQSKLSNNGNFNFSEYDLEKLSSDPINYLGPLIKEITEDDSNDLLIGVHGDIDEGMQDFQAENSISTVTAHHAYHPGTMGVSRYLSLAGRDNGHIVVVATGMFLGFGFTFVVLGILTVRSLRACRAATQNV
ncbi:hypothetical protein CC78DRAFT_580231 [Lojkania enalia]|uniref:Uncharacterized protein n=1 Tax=Lojkania enalia TaxID=147567 RepID=A0A9P4K9R4_9PLEO|nr:hypothetical protein CC78DRAFT_580231 [Didymosphaeria enalia]